eukprot:TRINITY_DN31653_c0_g1_i2.p1 TRINITY_DN31653_c0_g1~~TRINITY_DN31653_c0_g1_i2.p1  ORF type:complete len:375 (-),score=54.77 TRINITY_DN31653_c0_g1_i2:18-1142(-)
MSDELVVPIRLQAPIRNSSDYFFEFFRNYLESFRRERQPDQALEIELRLGDIFSYLDPQIPITRNILLEQLSDQSPCIINVNTPIDELQLGRFFGYTPGSSNSSYRFESGLREEEFFKVLGYMEFLYKYQTKRFRSDLPAKDLLTVDFQVDDRRFDYDLENKKFTITTKTKRSNVNLVYLKFALRMAACFEEKKHLDERAGISTLKSSKIKSVRVKLRRCFYYQFMEFSFTQTVSLDEKSGNSVNFSREFIQAAAANRADVALRYLFSGKRTFEVESEIIDVRFFEKKLNAVLESNFDLRSVDEFKRWIQAFIQNVVSLQISREPREYRSRQLIKLLNAEAEEKGFVKQAENVIIGDYLISLSNRKFGESLPQK